MSNLLSVIPPKWITDKTIELLSQQNYMHLLKPRCGRFTNLLQRVFFLQKLN